MGKDGALDASLTVMGPEWTRMGRVAMPLVGDGVARVVVGKKGRRRLGQSRDEERGKGADGFM